MAARLRTAAVSAVVVGVGAIATVYAWSLARGAAPDWAPWVLAPAIGLAMTGAPLLSVASRPGPVGGRLAFAFATTFFLIAGGFLLALVLGGDGEPLILGLPRRAAVVLYGVGILPVLVLPVAYALTFDDEAVSDDALQRLRESAQRTPRDGTGEP